jgi:hypothetical protein
MVYRNLFFVLYIIRVFLRVIRRNVALPAGVTLGRGPWGWARIRSTHFEPPAKLPEGVDIKIELTEREPLGFKPVFDFADAHRLELGVEGAAFSARRFCCFPLSCPFRLATTLQINLNYIDVTFHHLLPS